MTKNSGYFTLSRKIDEWEYLNQPLALALWIHLLRLAAWKDTEDLKRGEILTSAVELSKITGIDREIITRWLKAFESSGQIQTEKIGKFTKISLLNYEKYNPRRAEKSAGEPKSPAEISADTCGNIRTKPKSPAEISADTCGNIRTKTDDPSLLKRIKEEDNDIEEMNKYISDTDGEKPAVEIVDREDAWFREFWKEYPKKVAKKDAHKAFMKACRNEQTFNEIMAGLEQSKAISWSRRDMKYIPNAATWLNGERWTDDLEDQRIRDPYLKSLMDEIEKGDSNESEGSENHTDFDPFDVSWYRKQWNNG